MKRFNKSTSVFFHGQVRPLQKAIESAGSIIDSVYNHSIRGRRVDYAKEMFRILQILQEEALEIRRLPKGTRKVPGFPDYCINRKGIVYTRNVRGSKGQRLGPWWKMKAIFSKGYHHVSLLNPYGPKRIVKRFGIHQLILLAFVGPMKKGQMVRHLDGNPSNNRLSNLAYGTSRDNYLDSVRHGTAIRGERVHGAVLTEDLVRIIRLRFSRGEKQRAISTELELSPMTVHCVVRRKTWKHI